MNHPFNPTEVEKFLSALGHSAAGGCTEIRIIPKSPYLIINGKREYVGNIVAGYYTDYAKAARDIEPFDGRAHIYATANPCDKKLMRRAQNRLQFNAKETAGDRDIVKICWFLLDVDPKRPAGTSASDAEVQVALERRDRIKEEVFDPRSVPVIPGMSGNGGHGIIPLIGYPNDAETQRHLKRLLDWLSATYTDDTVSVDASVGNPARIWKVYGTLACKGDNTPSAPYRRAVIELPDSIQPFDLLALLFEIVPPDWQPANERTKNTKGSTRRASSGDDYPLLDLEKYLSHYGYSFNIKQKDGRTLYILDQCPFDPNHDQGEVCITQDALGKLGFKCFHNSCQALGWQEAKAVIGDPFPFYRGSQTHSNSARNGNGEASQDHERESGKTQEQIFDEIRKAMGEAAMLDEGFERNEAIKSIIERLVFLSPIDQAAWIEKMKQVGLGSKATLESQLKATRRAIWDERREKTQDEADNDLPLITTTNRHLRDITQEAMDALLRQNEKAPRLFVRGGVLTRIKTYESQALIAEVLTTNALRGELARAANFVGGKDFLGNPVQQPIAPPTEVVNDLISLPRWDGIPTLIGINHAPVLTTEGTFDATPGYQPKSRFYYAPDKRLKIGDTTPTKENVEAAKSLIFGDLLGDFCFADDDSKANALALMLLPFVRPLIDGQTPLHLIDAPVEGSGKGLLADVLTIPFKPDGGTLMTEGESDEEWRKRITAALSEGPSHILIDNINQRLESGSLAAVLTARVWSDRQLGSNAILKFPVTQTWIATGNNVSMSPEITRRTVWIRLRPSVEDPAQSKFKIENLRKWALEHRGELLCACLTLIQKWVDMGMPRGSARKGSYEDWAQIMSGILDAIGVEGFLGNYARLSEKANENTQMWREFVRAWHAKHGTSEVGVAELFLIASIKESYDADGRKIEIGQNLLDSLLRSDKEQGRKIKLGDLLKEQVDRVYGNYRIVRADMKNNAAQYCLEPLDGYDESNESSKSKNPDSLTDSPAIKHSVHQGSGDCYESDESKQTHIRGGEGGIYTPPDNGMEEKTDSPDSPPPVKPASSLNQRRYESANESQKTDSPDSPVSSSVAIHLRGSADRRTSCVRESLSPAESCADVPKEYVAFLLGWYNQFQNHPAYTTTLLRIAKDIFPVKMGLSVSDQMKRAIEALEGKKVCGLSMVKEGNELHLEGSPEGEVHR